MELLKAVEKVRENESIPDVYHMNVDDLHTLINIARGNSIYEALISAYRYGFIMGNHYTVNRKAKKI